MSTTDNVHLFVKAFETVLAFNTEVNAGYGAPTLCRDGVRIWRDEFRPMVTKIRDYLVLHRAALVRRLFADHIDDEHREALQPEFQRLIDDTGEPAPRSVLLFLRPHSKPETYNYASSKLCSDSGAGASGRNVVSARTSAHVDNGQQKLLFSSSGGGQQGRKTASYGEVISYSQLQSNTKTKLPELISERLDPF